MVYCGLFDGYDKYAYVCMCVYHWPISGTTPRVYPDSVLESVENSDSVNVNSSEYKREKRGKKRENEAELSALLFSMQSF